MQLKGIFAVSVCCIPLQVAGKINYHNGFKRTFLKEQELLTRKMELQLDIFHSL